MKRSIVVRWDLEGFHCWPDAPEQFKLLKASHGHIFHFECCLAVTNSSRQLEFLQVRRDLTTAIKRSYGSEPCDFRHNSCEMLAESLARTIFNLYGEWPAKVGVFEDSFVGAEVTYATS